MTMAAMCRPGMMGTMRTTSIPTSLSSAPNCNALPVFRPCAGLRIDLGNAISENHRNEILQQRIRSSGGKRRSRSVVRAGLPVVSSIPVVGPLANAIFNPVLLFIVYAAGAYRFYSGFQRTTYDNSPTTKLSMTALWPVLFLASKAYRSNFKKAVS